MANNKDKEVTPSLQPEQELQQSLMYLEQMKEQIITLREQLEILELAIKEHSQAIETLKDFKAIENDNEILIPIGADTLIFGKVLDKSKVIINVGAGIAMEENIKNALEKLTERMEKIETNKDKILTSITNLQDQAVRLNASIEERYRALQGDQAQNQNGNLGPPNVS
jgi:prefoldin alpha subunit